MAKRNKIIIMGTIIIILTLIITVTSYKVVTTHNNKILLVESKYIIETAKSCINDKVCTENHITLKELYDYGYLEKQVNGVTKEYYNEDSYVEVEDDGTYEFIIV